MSYGYLIFRTTQPVTGQEGLSEETTMNFGSGKAIRAQLDEAVPGIQWHEHHGTYLAEWGWLEFQAGTEEELGKAIAVNASFRQERELTEQFLQQLCDRFRWTAFDGQQLKLITWKE